MYSTLPIYRVHISPHNSRETPRARREGEVRVYFVRSEWDKSLTLKIVVLYKAVYRPTLAKTITCPLSPLMIRTSWDSLQSNSLKINNINSIEWIWIFRQQNIALFCVDWLKDRMLQNAKKQCTVCPLPCFSVVLTVDFTKILQCWFTTTRPFFLVLKIWETSHLTYYDSLIEETHVFSLWDIVYI